MKHVDIYQTVTNTIIEAIENGIEGKCELPWHGMSALPFNAKTQNPYNGINIPQLWACQMIGGHSKGVWATYRQWAELGAQVKKGSKGVSVVFWKQYEQEADNENDEANIRMFARYSTVFNIDQVEGYTLPALDFEPAEIKPNELADSLINATGIKIVHIHPSAYYDMVQDKINMPCPESFKGSKDGSVSDNYYSVLLHETIHATGHKSRLDRINLSKFGSPDYAFEELVAELGSAMCCAITGIETTVREDHSKYIKNWLHALKGDKKFIFAASSHAQKAVDYLYSFQEKQKEAA